MPKDATKNVDRYKIRGGHLNEFEYTQNQKAVAEKKPKGGANLIPGTPPEQLAEDVQPQVKAKPSKATKATRNSKASKATKTSQALKATKSTKATKAAKGTKARKAAKSTKKAKVNSTKGATPKKLAARKAAKKK